MRVRAKGGGGRKLKIQKQKKIHRERHSRFPLSSVLQLETVMDVNVEI